MNGFERFENLNYFFQKINELCSVGKTSNILTLLSVSLVSADVLADVHRA